jgi:hypothetical protein
MGCRSWSSRSTALAQPGHTPYVRDAQALDRLYEWWSTVFTYLRQQGVVPTTIEEIVTAAGR